MGLKPHRIQVRGVIFLADLREKTTLQGGCFVIFFLLPSPVRRPSRVFDALTQCRVHGEEHRRYAVEIIEQLRQKHQCSLEVGAGGCVLALREKKTPEIVAGLGVIGLELQDLLIEPGRFVRLSMVLVEDRLAEQLACFRPHGRLASPAGNGDLSALHAHRAALFSIHRKFRAPAHRRTIATRGPRKKPCPATRYGNPTENSARSSSCTTGPGGQLRQRNWQRLPIIQELLAAWPNVRPTGSARPEPGGSAPLVILV